MSTVALMHVERGHARRLRPGYNDALVLSRSPFKSVCPGNVRIEVSVRPFSKTSVATNPVVIAYPRCESFLRPVFLAGRSPDREGSPFSTTVEPYIAGLARGDACEPEAVGLDMPSDLLFS